MHGVNPIIYRWRWMWLVLWLIGLVLGLCYLLDTIDLPRGVWPVNDWIRLVEYYYFGDRFSLLDGWGLEDVFGLQWGWDGFAVVAVCIVVAWYTISALVLIMPRRGLRDLPALRPIQPLQRVTAASMLAMVAVAIVWEVIARKLEAGLDLLALLSDGLTWELMRYLWILPGVMIVVATVIIQSILRTRDHRHDRYWRLERLTRVVLFCGLTLYLGSHVVMRVTGDWLHTGYVVGYFVLLWAFGVRTLLLFMLRRYEKARAQHNELVCFACDYDLRGSIPAGARTCPECGAPIAKRLLDGAEAPR